MSPAPTREAQLEVLHQAITAFWGQDAAEAADALGGIRVVNAYHGGKIMGTVPAFAGKPAAFFKVYFYERGFKFESAGLRAANAMPPVHGVSVPRVVAVMPEFLAILTEHKNWEDNRSALRRYFVRSLGIDWERVGHWLRAFHDSQGPQPPNDAFVRYKMNKIELHLQALGHHFTPDQVDRMRQIIEGAQASFARGAGDWVLSHGDFGLSNIQTSGDGIDIIDFEDCQVAPRSFDLLNCLVRLDYLRTFPHLPGAYCSVERELLAGYGMPLAHTPVEDFLTLLIKLDILESYERRKKEKPQFNPIQRMVFCYFQWQGISKIDMLLHNNHKRIP